LARLIDDLLEVSRISTGRMHLQKDCAMVNVIVERAVETVRPLIDQRGHELFVSLPPEPIWLHADAARLQQVVVNLLTNAAKYTPDSGCIRLFVEPDGEECVLRVRDTGVGIPSEFLPHVFDLFTQAERSLDRSEGGLGIGLALVQRIVEMHQGKVAVISTPGEGAEFVMRLPAVPAPRLRPTPRPSESPEPVGLPLRILVVDDNVDTAQTLAMLLKMLGHEVRTAHTGPAALQATNDYQPSLLLLDIGIPGMNGYEVARQIREQPILDGVMLVAITGYGQEADLQLARQAGFDHHLVKPTDFSELERILATVSTKARSY
jgi:CheY-like chemotaxis protein